MDKKTKPKETKAVREIPATDVRNEIQRILQTPQEGWGKLLRSWANRLGE